MNDSEQRTLFYEGENLEHIPRCCYSSNISRLHIVRDIFIYNFNCDKTQNDFCNKSNLIDRKQLQNFSNAVNKTIMI